MKLIAALSSVEVNRRRMAVMEIRKALLKTYGRRELAAKQLGISRYQLMALVKWDEERIEEEIKRVGWTETAPLAREAA